jgi:hypothetical protein
LAATFLAGAFFTAFAGAAFFAAALAGAFFGVGFDAALPALREATVADFAFPGLVSFAVAAGLFFCAFPAVELRVVFAISLHRFGRGGRVL